MNILYITQFYPPEIGAGAYRAESITKGLKGRHHRLTVIAEVPNYPTGVIHKGYRNHLWHTSTLDGIDIHRVWVKVTPKMNYIRRLLFYFSFNITAIVRGISLTKKFDLVYATSPPLFVGMVGFVLSRFFRIPFVFEVRDLWPEIAIELGMIKGKLAIYWSTLLEKFLYRRSLYIVTVTQGFKNKIIKKGISAKKIHVIQNFSKVNNSITQRNIDNDLLTVYKNKFVVIYAGLLGLFQGVDVIIKAANILQNEKRIVFHIIGAGAEKNNLLTMSDDMKLNNIVWTDPQPDSIIHYLLTKADCAVVPLRDLPGLRVTIPSKLFDYMGCGCPVILSAAGEVAKILQKVEAGLVVKPEDPRQLAEAILKIYKKPALKQRYSKNARMAVKNLFSSNVSVSKINRLLKTLDKKY